MLLASFLLACDPGLSLERARKILAFLVAKVVRYDPAWEFHNLRVKPRDAGQMSFSLWLWGSSDTGRQIHPMVTVTLPTFTSSDKHTDHRGDVGCQTKATRARRPVEWMKLLSSSFTLGSRRPIPGG
jgi:hypothetical protein